MCTAAQSLSLLCRRHWTHCRWLPTPASRSLRLPVCALLACRKGQALFSGVGVGVGDDCVARAAMQVQRGDVKGRVERR
jgi:hypothetical protein